VFNFCALNQTTESVRSAQVHAKWISARTPHGLCAESVDCAQSVRTGCGLHRTPHSPHQTGLDPWGSVNYCKSAIMANGKTGSDGTFENLSCLV
jgi:hypothetical protein